MHVRREFEPPQAIRPVLPEQDTSPRCPVCVGTRNVFENDYTIKRILAQANTG